MKKILIMALLFIGFTPSIVSAQQTVNPTVYGQAFEQTKLLSPARLPMFMKDHDDLDKITLTGYVSEVCQKEGCWLKLSTSKNSHDDIFVKMKDHAFLLPKDIAGKTAIVYGEVEKEEQSVAEQKHYLKDSGASSEAINAITKPKMTYVVEATGVKIF